MYLKKRYLSFFRRKFFFQFPGGGGSDANFVRDGNHGHNLYKSLLCHHNFTCCINARSEINFQHEGIWKRLKQWGRPPGIGYCPAHQFCMFPSSVHTIIPNRTPLQAYNGIKNQTRRLKDYGIARPTFFQPYPKLQTYFFGNWTTVMRRCIQLTQRDAFWATGYCTPWTILATYSTNCSKLAQKKLNMRRINVQKSLR